MTQAPLPKCPNCNSIVIPTRARCVSCGMEVAKMEEMRQAQAAAGKRGGRPERSREGSRGQADEGPRRYGRWIGIGLVVLLVGGLGLYFFKDRIIRPKPWLDLPTDPQQAVTDYLHLIGTAENDAASGNAAHNKAYKMLASSVRKYGDAEEANQFLQYHHMMYVYLWSVTDNADWFNMATVDPDPADTARYVVTIGTEVYHIRVVDDSPAELKAKGEHHWAVMPIEESNPYSGLVADSRMLGLARGVMSGYGAGGALPNLQSALDLGKKRLNDFERKVWLLPQLNNRHITGLNLVVIDLWPVRKDPTVIARLRRVADDGRYDSVVRERALQVLEDRLPEEDRIYRGFD